MESVESIKREFNDLLKDQNISYELRFDKIQQEHYKHEARLISHANESLNLRQDLTRLEDLSKIPDPRVQKCVNEVYK